MGFKLKFKDVNSEVLVKALIKLGGYEGFKDPRFSYNIAKIIRRFDSESKLAQEQYVKLMKQYGNLDEKGQLTRNEKGNFIADEKMEEWKSAVEVFNEIEFEVDCYKIRLDQLAGVGFSALELASMEPILTELELVQAPEAISA